MFTTKLSFLSIVLLTFSLLIAPNSVLAQDEDQELIDEQVEAVEEEFPEDEALEYSSIWDLVGQAGGIRYPIYAILIIGIFLISLRSYELYMDSNQQKDLQSTSFRHLSLNEITSKVATQQDFMLSRIMAKLLNVFQTNRNADYLHDEIANYNTVQQDNFTTFKNRIDFLSDTAGALGLLGTVWGMFMVFSSGTLEREIILVGMGIALLSTFLGLVVSIILNFCSTLTEGYFSKHLETVTNKADELRFRLIELSETSQSTFTQTKSPVQVTSTNNSNRKEEAAEKSTVSKASDDKSDVKKIEKLNEPEIIKLKSSLKPVKSGESFDDIEVQLIGKQNEPVKDHELEIILEGDGQINGTKNKTTITTDNKGAAILKWSPDTNVGEKKAMVRCKKNTNVKLVLKSEVTASEPENLKLLNNHQAGLTGQELQKPITAIITDKYENPVPSVNVLMKVSMGNGKFENGKRETSTKSDDSGKVFINFELGSEPGFNAVDISLPKFDITKSFQAVGQEVTV